MAKKFLATTKSRFIFTAGVVTTGFVGGFFLWNIQAGIIAIALVALYIIAFAAGSKIADWILKGE